MVEEHFFIILDDQQNYDNNQSYLTLDAYENEDNEFFEGDLEQPIFNENEQFQDQLDYNDEEVTDKYQINTSSPYIPKPLMAKDTTMSTATEMDTKQPVDNANNTSQTIFDSKFRVRKFSDAIRSELERKFLENNFISGIEKTQLARRLELTERQVQKWFVHRREKLRRHEKKYGLVLGTSPSYYQQSSKCRGLLFF